MRERPILFSAPMVRALLAGNKTQTRRVVKPQPPLAARDAGCITSSTDPSHVGAWWWLDSLDLLEAGVVGEEFRCPHGQPGDRLWVRETFATCGSRVRYRADQADPNDYPGVNFQPWRPSIHMPRSASRITLEITDVRVQRLHDITCEDILAEGVRVPACEQTGNALIDISTPDGPGAFLTREQFKNPDALLRAHWAALWCAINGRASWDANPWVWAITFQRVEGTA